MMTKREELDKILLDEEVEELDKVDRKTEEAYAHVTDWLRLSCYPRRPSSSRR